METSSAAEQLFAVPELLEQILLLQSPYDLLVNAQRVSRTFHATIAGSKKLQCQLFMKPESSEDATESLEPTLNPFLEKMFPPDMKRYFDALLRRVDFCPNGTTDKVILRGKHCKSCCCKYFNLQEELDDETFYIHLPEIDLKWKPFSNAQRDVGASWRRMFACLPHSSEIHRANTLPLTHKQRIQGGLKMGDVMEQLVLNTPDNWRDVENERSEESEEPDGSNRCEDVSTES